MDKGKNIKQPFLHFDLNSVPISSDSSHHSSEDIDDQQHSFPSKNKITNQSFLQFDLNAAPRCSKSSDHSSQNVDSQQHTSRSKRQRLPEDMDVDDIIVARKIHKANHEKLRRDQLNEQFLALRNVLDSDRDKNDKKSILTDAIHMLKDLTSEISRLKLKMQHFVQNRLIQEKKELREEKASLKSDIQELAVLYRQAIRIIPPWAPVDRSEVVAHSFSYPNAFPVPSGPSPSHPPPLQPITLFGNQSGVPFHSSSTIFPCQTPATSQIHHPSSLNASTSYISREQGFNGMSSGGNSDKVDDRNGVVTDLELELPGSTVQKLVPGDKGKQPMNESENVSNRSSLRLYSSRGFQGSSSRNMDDKC